MSKKSNQMVQAITLSPKQCVEAIRHMVGTDVTVFMWGPPGISKSATCRQIADELGFKFLDVRLSQMEPTDLRGIPYPAEEYDRTTVRWSTPECLPNDLDLSVTSTVKNGYHTFNFTNPHGLTPKYSVRSLDQGVTARIVLETDDDGKVLDVQPINKLTIETVDAEGNRVEDALVHWSAKAEIHAILALEELNSAPQSVQAAAYQLLLDRELGEYKVPKGVTIVCMGNRDTDRGVTFKMPTPISNRMVHIEMEPKFTDWQEWAVLKGNIDAAVVGFLYTFQENLFQFDAKSASRGFPTPRSWEFVSKISKRRSVNSISENVYLGLLSGAIGQSVALQFKQFQEMTAKLPAPADILSGKIKTTDVFKNETSLGYALIYSLVYALRDRISSMPDVQTNAKSKEEAIELIDRAMYFALENTTRELAVVAFSTAINMKIQHIPHTKSFKEFSKEMASIILS